MEAIPIEYINERIEILDIIMKEVKKSKGGYLWYLSRINALKELLQDWSEEDESNISD